jgi:hypothetical protein
MRTRGPRICMSAPESHTSVEWDGYIIGTHSCYKRGYPLNSTGLSQRPVPSILLRSHAGFRPCEASKVHNHNTFRHSLYTSNSCRCLFERVKPYISPPTHALSVGRCRAGSRRSLSHLGFGTPTRRICPYSMLRDPNWLNRCTYMEQKHLSKGHGDPSTRIQAT